MLNISTESTEIYTTNRNLHILEEKLYKDIKQFIIYQKRTLNAVFVYQVKPLSIINCNHLFHTELINRWLDKVEECPMCRTKYSKTKNIEKIKSEYEM